MSLEIMQSELLTSEVTLSDIPCGDAFQLSGGKDVFIRVKATSFLLNSNVITDILNRGDALVVNLTKGTLYPMKKVAPVRRLHAVIKYNYI